MKDGLKTVKYLTDDVPFDDNFWLCLTSKMPNPHYLPEICIKFTVINFTVTFEGLEEQMLVDVVLKERREVEEQRIQLSINLANFKGEITKIEKDILATLASSDPDTILDSDTLINILDASKEKAHLIKVQLQEAMIIEENVRQT